MKITAAKQAIVSRTLRDADTGEEVAIAIGLPQQISEQEWICAFRIDGRLEDDAHGVDAFQALLLAIEALHYALGRSTQRLTWFDGEPGDAGVPRLAPTSFGLAFRKRIEDMIEEEIARVGEEAQLRCRLRTGDAP